MQDADLKGEFQKDVNAALVTAAARGDKKKVETLLLTNADVHDGEDEALRVAARNGHSEAVRKQSLYKRRP